MLTAAAFSNLIPIFSLLLSAIILHEVLTVTQWLSIAVVFLGVMISQRHKPSVRDDDDPLGQLEHPSAYERNA